MITEIFHIGSLSISPFGVMFALAYAVAYLQLRWGLKRQRIGDDDDASAILLAAGIGGVVGGKVYYALLTRDWHSLYSRAGLVWYGGFLLATVLVVWAIRRRRLPPWATADAAALAVAVGYAVGRIGCFLVGDDYGRPTDLPWGVRFPVGPTPSTAESLRSYGFDVPAGVAPDALVAVHPTQLYETGLALVIWVVGMAWFKRRSAAGAGGGVGRAGSTALLVVGLMAVERFGIEVLRAKDDRFFGPITLAQVISMVVVVAVVALALWRRSRARSAAG